MPGTAYIDLSPANFAPVDFSEHAAIPHPKCLPSSHPHPRPPKPNNPISRSHRIGMSCMSLLPSRLPAHQFINSFQVSHHSTLDIPIPDRKQAQIIIDAISPDKPIKSPLLVRRSIELVPTPSAVSIIRINLAALTLRQARMSMDHLINDVDLVIETLVTFA